VHARARALQDRRDRPDGIGAGRKGRGFAGRRGSVAARSRRRVLVRGSRIPFFLSLSLSLSFSPFIPSRSSSSPFDTSSSRFDGARHSRTLRIADRLLEDRRARPRACEMLTSSAIQYPRLASRHLPHSINQFLISSSRSSRSHVRCCGASESESITRGAIAGPIARPIGAVPFALGGGGREGRGGRGAGERGRKRLRQDRGAQSRAPGVCFKREDPRPLPGARSSSSRRSPRIEKPFLFLGRLSSSNSPWRIST